MKGGRCLFTGDGMMTIYTFLAFLLSFFDTMFWIVDNFLFLNIGLLSSSKS